MASRVFPQSSLSSEPSIDLHFGVASQDSEGLDSQQRPVTGGGPASFLGLLNRLRVPILDATSNRSGLIDAFFVGAGSSYNVTQSLSTLESHGVHSPQIKIDQKLKRKRYVVKRILPPSASQISDERQLEAITNEVRILANNTLKKVPFIVKLLCVAWDETPTQGRCWPRLLLECADYGNLAQFMAQHEPSRAWRMKEKLLGDVLAGLNMLRCHHVVHGDLKLENVLVFAADASNQSELPGAHGVSYTAKLCDFGFSVIMSDYEEDATVTKRLGTDPWNAPELAYGTPTKVQQLPKADVYSFALLICRVMMHGGNPFHGMDSEEVRRLKQIPEGIELYQKVGSAVFGTERYPKIVELTIRRVLILSLGHKPEQRIDLDHVGEHFMMLLSLTDEDLMAVGPNESAESMKSTSANADEAQPLALGAHGTAQSWPVVPISQAAAYALALIGQALHAAVVTATQKVRRSLRAILEYLGFIEGGWDGLRKPAQVFSQPTAPLEPFREPFRELLDEAEEMGHYIRDPHSPDFEFFRGWSKPDRLPPGAEEELMKALHEQAGDSSGQSQPKRASAAYQLSIVYFQGSSVMRRNIDKSLEWLQKATMGGCHDAISGCHNIFEACNRQLPSELEAEIKRQVPEVAQAALAKSLFQSLSNLQAQKDDCIAVGAWSQQDRPGYLEYVGSAEHGHLSALCLATHSRIVRLTASKGGNSEAEFDFGLLDGYDHYDVHRFGPYDKVKFIESVRSHNCVEATGFGGLTLLQTAAARGDLVLAEIMVNDLGAKVDSVGKTQGYTPLWISSLTGNIHVAEFLAAHAADLRCKDTARSRTILHFVNKCRSDEDLATLFNFASRAGLDLDTRDANGNTPLLSTFIGWDFSGGLAARRLIEKSANILVTSNEEYTALGLAVGRLNVELVHRLVEDMNKQRQTRAGATTVSDLSPNEVKADGFLSLANHTEFYNARLAGRHALSKLEEIVEILLDEGSVEAVRSSKYSKDTNPLIGACFVGNEDLVFAVLGATHCPNINEVDHNGCTALQWAVERHKLRAATELLKRGADPLMKSKEGFTVFHTASIHSPDLVESLLKATEEAEVTQSRSLASMLKVTDRMGLSPFALMVTEGSPDHLAAAEQIRAKYDLPFDELNISTGSDESIQQTLLAALIEGINISKIFSLRSVKYLLELEPRPRLVCRTDGATLLHLAVESWHHDNYSSNSSGYAALNLLLEHYRTAEDLAKADNTGCTVLHRAATVSHLTAIKIIHDHTRRRNIIIDFNAPDRDGFTPLDYTGRIVNALPLDSETCKVTLESIRLRTAETYEYLREQGAWFSHEFRPVVVTLMGRCQDEISKSSFIQFTAKMSRRLGLHWEFVEETLDNGMEGTKEASFILELAWRFDRFILDATQVPTAGLEEHIARRVEHRHAVVTKTNNWPWMKAEYEETIQGHAVRWKRPGRVWTVPERKRLTAELEAAWKQMFPSGSSETHLQDMRRF